MIEHISLTNFRTYAQREFELAPLTVLTGGNGAGKTNVLEAVSMLSMTTSWRTEKDSEVVRWGEPFARVVSGDLELVVQRQPYLKRLRIDGVSKRTYQVIGHFPTVLFQPDDIQILYGSPSARRHYLDRTLSQISHAYTRAVLELQQVLKQRNRLLKNISEGTATADELGFWDQQLAGLHATIQKERDLFIQFLTPRLPEIFGQMVEGGETVRAEYQKSPRHAEEDFLTYVSRQRMKEIAAGVSLYGPQREDIVFWWGEHLVEQSVSRGQGRALLLACKIVELEYISLYGEKRPVLLLDDIFSELDRERRERLFDVFGDYQVIMTTTDLGDIEEGVRRRAVVTEL